MPSIRVRAPFAAAFAVLLLLSAYLGLSSSKIPQYGHSDKGLHFVTFFLLTATFYFILDTSRRRVLHLTLIVCTGALSLGSEFVQGYLPNGRIFDSLDIVANVAGSLLALMLCAWYHKRMLERRRKNRHYGMASGDDGDVDIELGESTGEISSEYPPGQETGIVSAAEAPAITDVTEELDNWDENAEDWEDDAGATDGDTKDTKRRTD